MATDRPTPPDNRIYQKIKRLTLEGVVPRARVRDGSGKLEWSILFCKGQLVRVSG